MKPRVMLIVSVFCACISMLSAQSTQEWEAKETTILLNGEPTRVILAKDGQIVEILGKPKGFSFARKQDQDRILPADNRIRSAPENSEIDVNASSGLGIELRFHSRDATLSSNTLRVLDDVAKRYQRGEIQHVRIVSPANASNRTLAANRADACSRYLALKGIRAEQIQVDIIAVGETNVQKAVRLLVQ